MRASRLRAFIRLGRTRIALAAGFSAMVGYLLSAYVPGTFMALNGLGVFLLTCGASAFNQYQERYTDAMMERTKSRPLPSGEINTGEALVFTCCSAIAGLACIYTSGGLWGLLSGLFAVAWYNGIYTGLKRTTAFAAVPGALVGAVPPFLGWHSGGGRVDDPALALVCLFFFLWQVPHFWLYAMRYGKEYSTAGLPSITRVFSDCQLSRIVFVWIMSLAVVAMLFIPYGLAINTSVRYLITAISILLVLQAGRLLGRGQVKTVYRPVLGSVNLYTLVIMVLLAADRIAV